MGCVFVKILNILKLTGFVKKDSTRNFLKDFGDFYLLIKMLFIFIFFQCSLYSKLICLNVFKDCKSLRKPTRFFPQTAL